MPRSIGNLEIYFQMDTKRIKEDFPIFKSHPHTYLDNAATTHKPKAVLDAMVSFQSSNYGTVHRGIYELSARATAAYEEARSLVQGFINAVHSSEIIFTSGATDGINLVASSYLNDKLTAGDNVVCSIAEHHANFIPWQQLSLKNSADFRCMPIDANGGFDLRSSLALIDDRTKLVAIQHISNVLGIINPIEDIINKAKTVGAKVLIDAAQSIAHLPIDVQSLDCDFLVFSGHKIYGPTGIGVLFGKHEILEEMPPHRYGGEMIERVTVNQTTWRKPPHRFEAGTPATTEVIGLAAALKYLQNIGLQNIRKHSRELTKALWEALDVIPKVKILGRKNGDRHGAVSFNLEGIHPHDLASILDHHRVSIRAGHHCAQPLMDALGLQGSARASIGIYNNQQDIYNLVAGLKAAMDLLL